jgi:hypothetical protein
LGVEAGVGPAAYASALRDIAQRMRAAAAGAEPVPATAADAPAVATSAGDPGDLAAMVASCEDCRASATGQPAAHDLDMLRHHREGHAEQLAQLLARLADAAQSDA